MDIRQKVLNGDYNSALDYDADKAAYRADDLRLQNQFKSDMALELQKCGVPAEYCHGIFKYAYQEGHSGGYSEICNVAEDIASVVFGK